MFYQRDLRLRPPTSDFPNKPTEGGVMMIFAVYNVGLRVSRWQEASSCWLKRRLSRLELSMITRPNGYALAYLPVANASNRPSFPSHTTCYPFPAKHSSPRNEPGLSQE